MSNWVLLLRGINVGGNNLLKMQALKDILTDLKLENIQTYIQSGNVVFQARRKPTPTFGNRIGNRIGKRIQETHGFQPQILLLPASDLAQAIADNPFPQAEVTPKTLHLFFLAQTPQTPDNKAMESCLRDDEQFVLTEKVLYLHSPSGLAKSKFAERVERFLGVAATARNWRTVLKLQDMIEALEA